MISSQNCMLQLNQILDVPVTQMIEQLEEVQKMVSQNRIQRRAAQQIVDMPVLKLVAEHVEIALVSRRTGFHRSSRSMSAGSAPRRVELKRLPMCQPGKRQTSFGRSSQKRTLTETHFKLRYMSWKGSCFSLFGEGGHFLPVTWAGAPGLRLSLA